MADSHREKIVQRFVKVLTHPGAGQPPGLSVHRQPTRSLEEDELPAAVPWVAEEAVELVEHGDTPAESVVQRTLQISVDHRAMGAGDDPELAGKTGDQLVDASLTWAITALIGDATLMAMVFSLEETGTEWQQAELDEVLAQASQGWEVIYHTPENDPTTLVTR